MQSSSNICLQCKEYQVQRKQLLQQLARKDQYIKHLHNEFMSSVSLSVKVRELNEKLNNQLETLKAQAVTLKVSKSFYQIFSQRLVGSSLNIRKAMQQLQQNRNNLSEDQEILIFVTAAVNKMFAETQQLQNFSRKPIKSHAKKSRLIDRDEPEQYDESRLLEPSDDQLLKTQQRNPPKQVKWASAQQSRETRYNGFQTSRISNQRLASPFLAQSITRQRSPGQFALRVESCKAVNTQLQDSLMEQFHKKLSRERQYLEILNKQTKALLRM